MKKNSSPRSYRMGARATAAAQTARNILGAATELWREKSLEDITLQEIAERAGVTVQTVLRRFGSKEGVVAACVETDAAGGVAERDKTPPGNVAQAIEILLAHYERDGDAMLRTLALEHRLLAAKIIVDMGRREHRAWCSRIFAEHLSHAGAAHHDLRLDAFVAVTDLYLWKLLRRDLGRSESEAKLIFMELLQGPLAAGKD